MRYPTAKKFAILASNLFIFKHKNVAYQPWRCLWRGFLQITRTTRLRRTILQLRQILFTDASTFMSVSFQPDSAAENTEDTENETRFKPCCSSRIRAFLRDLCDLCG